MHVCCYGSDKITVVDNITEPSIVARRNMIVAKNGDVYVCLKPTCRSSLIIESEDNAFLRLLQRDHRGPPPHGTLGVLKRTGHRSRHGRSARLAFTCRRRQYAYYLSHQPNARGAVHAASGRQSRHEPLTFSVERVYNWRYCEWYR